MGSRYKQREPPILINIHGGNNLQKIYTCGDTVSGTVRVDTRSKTTRVSIGFEGKMTAKISRSSGNSRKVYKSKIYLFRFTSLLYSGEDIESFASPGDPFVAFPFKFRFPSEVRLSPEASGCQLLEGSYVFEHEPGHALPASMRAELSGLGGHSATIEYYLEAQMATPPHRVLTIHNDKKTREPLTFCPAYPSLDLQDELPDPQFRQHAANFSRHSHRLSPTFNPSLNHGIRSRLKDLFPSSKDPFATFTVTITAPTAVRAGRSPCPITLSLRHRDRSPDLLTSPPPPVFLRGFRVTLRALTAVRVAHHNPFTGTPHQLDEAAWGKIDLAARHFRGPNDDDDDDIATTGKFDETLAPPAPEFPPDGTPLRIDDLLPLHEGGGCGVGRMCQPAFRSYVVARTYELRVTVWVECAGKVFEVRGVEAHPLNVLPFPTAREEYGDEEGERGAAAVERPLVIVDEAPPPPYQEAAPPYQP